MMKHLTILLALVCVLAYVGSARSQCCRRSMSITYTVGSGTCERAGGRRSGPACSINICADGRRLVGYYCGRQSCNIFGCNCGGGCITGEWQQSFMDNNVGQIVRVLSTRWHN